MDCWKVKPLQCICKNRYSWTFLLPSSVFSVKTFLLVKLALSCRKMWHLINALASNHLAIFFFWSNKLLAYGENVWLSLLLGPIYTIPPEGKIHCTKSKLCLHYSVWHKWWISSERCARIENCIQDFCHNTYSVNVQSFFDLASSQTVQQARSKPIDLVSCASNACYDDNIWNQITQTQLYVWLTL